MLRVIANVPYLSHTENLFKTYSMLSIHDLYNYRLSTKLTTECYYKTSSLVELSGLQHHIVPYQIRNPDYWQVPTCRLNTGKEMAAYRIPKLLNVLHSEGAFIDTLALRVNCALTWKILHIRSDMIIFFFFLV